MATDWGASGRTDEYSFFRVDPYTLANIEEIDVDAENSSITWGLDTDNRVSATLHVLNDVVKDSMVRIVHTVEADGDTSTRTLATLFPETNGTSSTFGTADRAINCYGALWRHSHDYLRTDHAYGPGDNCIGVIKEIVEADGGQLYVHGDAPVERTHTKDLFWGVGTNKLEMIETIAGWIDAEIGVTPDGMVSVRAYVPPGRKPVSFEFVEGANCLYEPGIEWEDTRDDAINRVIAFYSTDEESDTACADLDPGHPYSAERIGRKKTYVMELSEPCTHEELVAKATNYLNEHAGSQVYIEITHAGVPGLECGQVVTYTNSIDYPDPISARFLVTEMSIDSLGPGCMTRTKMRWI